jgi:hypothetical protein
MLLVIKDMLGLFSFRLVTVRNASMQGVGTKMGTVSVPLYR